MKLLAILFLSLSSLTHTYHQPAQGTKANYVYICDSKSAYAYHNNTDRSGLKRCTHEIKKITKKEAIKLGRNACKKCY